MFTKSFLSAAALGMLAVAFEAAPAGAQVYYRRVMPNPVIISTTQVVASPPMVAPAPATAGDCSCGPTTTGNCDCKHGLACHIMLPPNCHTHTGTKKPIETHLLGKVPKVSRNVSCYDYEVKFEWETEVPQVVCETQTCVEIGKKTVECMPGCNFEVCVPVEECCDKVEKCELVLKKMRMVAKHRREGGWDFYVINDPNPASPYHAGGMPNTWLIYHCLGAEGLKEKFPGQSFAAQAAPTSTEKTVATKTPAKLVKPAATTLAPKAVAATPKAAGTVKPAPTKSVG